MGQQGIDKLVESAAKGDRQAYGELVGQFYRSVLMECLAVLGQLHDAEDTAQEVMLQGFMKLPTLRNPAVPGLDPHDCPKRVPQPPAKAESGHRSGSGLGGGEGRREIRGHS